MDPLLHVRLVLQADEVIDPEVITARLGLEPTQTFIKGTERTRPNGQATPPWAGSGWILSLYEQSVDLPGLLTRLITTLEPVSVALAEIRDELNLSGWIGVHLKMADQTPVGDLDAELLRRLVALDLGLDLDLYVVDDDYQPVDADRYGIASAGEPS